MSDINFTDEMNYYQNIYLTAKEHEDLKFIIPHRNTDWSKLRDRTKFKGIKREIAFLPGSKDNFAAVVLSWEEDVLKISYPKDAYYFSKLSLLSIKYDKNKLYNELKMLYNLTEDFLDRKVIQYIDYVSRDYGEDENNIYNLFLHIYYGMIAEEHFQRVDEFGNVKRTQVGKLVKMIGLSGFLLDNKLVSEVCVETCGMSIRRINELANKYGITREITWEPYSSKYDDPNDSPIIM